MKTPVPPILRALLAACALCVLAAESRSQTASPPLDPKKILTYRIHTTDKLAIRIFQEDDLSTICLVDAKGTVNLPLVGEIRVYGDTLEEAQSAIAKAYRTDRYLRNPEVTVTVEQYAEREVSIQGQVKSPGRYALPAESTMSLLDLVTRAQGFTDTAQGSSVRVTRILPDGSTHVYTVDVESMIKGRSKNKGEAFNLQPDDIVYVPERII